MPNVLGQRDCLVFRPDIADINCTTTNRCSISDYHLLQIFTVVELLYSLQGHQAVTQCVVSTESLSLILHGAELLIKCFEIQQRLVRGLVS